MLETTHALRIGAYIGLGSALVMLVLNLMASLLGSNAILFDPVPQFMYTFFMTLIKSVIDIAGNAPSLSQDGGPGPIGRFLFQLPSNLLFGAIGGAIAASLFKRETPIFR